jgi:class 3 adenylate cyclase
VGKSSALRAYDPEGLAAAGLENLLAEPVRGDLVETGYTRSGRCHALEVRRVERKLAAIFAADVEGYSRLMGRDEVGTLRTLTAYRVIIDRLIASHRGRIFNTAGDSLVADFASAVDAVQCAVEVQDALAKENADRPVGEQMRVRTSRSAIGASRPLPCAPGSVS